MITLDATELPDDLHWSNEYDWSATEQAEEYTVTGALILEPSTRLSGRPITLTSGSSPPGPAVPRSVLDQLYATTSPRVDMVLNYRGTSFTVRWRGPKPIEPVSMIPEQADPDAAALYWITLHFIEV